MDGFTRYALFVAPPPGPLADWAARWLGWDPVAGTKRGHPVVHGLPRHISEITASPRKYGFHGTVKPPFRLAEGHDVADLHAAAEALCAALPPVRLAGLRPVRLDRFLALIPSEPSPELAVLAARAVEGLDAFRAPPEEDELARRRKSGLTSRQEVLLNQWGYPYVMEEFRFHLTLSSAMPEAEANQTLAALKPHLAPLIEGPFRIGSLCLFGEGQDGRFRNLHRYRLTG